MAEYTVQRAAHKTLTDTTIDLVNIPAAVIDILNRVGTSPLWVTVNGEDPTAAGDNTHCIPPGSWKRINAQASTTELITVKVLGNGNEYSVEEAL